MGRGGERWPICEGAGAGCSRHEYGCRCDPNSEEREKSSVGPRIPIPGQPDRAEADVDDGNIGNREHDRIRQSLCPLLHGVLLRTRSKDEADRKLGQISPWLESTILANLGFAVNLTEFWNEPIMPAFRKEIHRTRERDERHSIFDRWADE